MIFEDIKPNDQKINNIAEYVLKRQPHEENLYGGKQGPYIKVYGEDLKKKFHYDFLFDALEITVYYDRKAMIDTYNVSEYYGDKVRVDVVALNDEGNERDKKSVKEDLRAALKEYVNIVSKTNQRHTYDFLNNN
ncbi:hypothetical protein PBI_SCTP2_257 [Salicola phage SCTP-2]|nr:hypothetical protein PBI_SCTP2_257 [Salicola phage SCTP-2]